MPKLKSHSGAKKRFIITSSGRVKYKQPGQRHLLSGMSSTRGRRLRKRSILAATPGKLIKALLPYS